MDNVEGFKPEQMMEVEKWIKFYEESYTFKGIFYEISLVCFVCDAEYANACKEKLK